MQLRTSVLVCNYNNGPFLRECLESVMAQTREPDEIIVADDGSTDESLAILDRMPMRISVLRLSHGTETKRLNQARAFQAAFQRSSGDIVFLLDGDDLFLPKKIAAYAEAFEGDPQVVMVQCPMILVDGTGQRLGLDIDAKRHWRDPLREMRRRQEVNIHYATSALAFRRTYLEARFPWADRTLGLATDTVLSIVAPLFGRVATLDEPLSVWRRHQNASTVRHPLDYFRETEKKRTYFNRYCRAHAFRPLRRWSSPRYCAYWMRNQVLPSAPPAWFRTLRWHLLSAEQRQSLLQRK
ncbi:hypothetical protein DB347_21325 [Opitutaceae bacterium EW11]|nr:hypothetical protein DB347_21325 [Opitutaceae bacterium EW11]